MIEIRGLSKAYGHTWALKDVDLDVPTGGFLSLFGPNGAGKTTLVRIAATLSKPTRGTVRVGGVDTDGDAAVVRRLLGMVSHQTFLYPDLTADENLQFYGRMYDVPDLPRRIDQVLELVGLAHRRTEPVRTYSRGMQQRLAIARAILHRPRILLLDEPYTGLDPHAAAMLREALRALLQEKHTVLMTTHDVERGLELCDRVAILASGRLAFESARRDLTVEEFQEIYSHHVAAAN